MNDEEIEKRLRGLPAPELPAAWRGEILATALREARMEAGGAARAVWPEVLVYLRRIFARNPVTAGALAAIWAVILFLRLNTPVDPAAREMMAHFVPGQPIYFVSMREEIKLAELWEQPPAGQRERVP